MQRLTTTTRILWFMYITLFFFNILIIICARDLRRYGSFYSSQLFGQFDYIRMTIFRDDALDIDSLVELIKLRFWSFGLEQRLLVSTFIA